MEMITPASRVIPVTSSDLSQIGNARRQAVAMAGALGFDESRQGNLSIVVTEAARNLAVHATSGELILSPWAVDDAVGIDVFALDKGKGIADVARALEDGYSTAGTAGEGLGAISRLAHEFRIYSASGHGTAVFARMLRDEKKTSAFAGAGVGTISTPLSGETLCGDAWAVVHAPERSVFIVADGLGHGPLAAEASQEAIRIFHLASGRAPEQILKEVHGALGKTRGAAVSVAEVLPGRRTLNYAGAGNVAGSIVSKGKSRSMISMNGTVGHAVGSFQSFAYPCEPGSLFLMYSDGLATRWSLDQYPGLGQQHPALIAAVLYRDFSRKRDDATIVVARIQPE